MSRDFICTVFAPWFGALPFYAEYFLASCAKAPRVQWCVASDQPPPTLPNNVLWLQLGCLHERISRVFPHQFVPFRQWGHKLCDLKPYWHVIFKDERAQSTEFRGWSDWDVVHDLSALPFDFTAAKFTPGAMCSPLYLQRTDYNFDLYPANLRAFFASAGANTWDEFYYLKHVDASILQSGLTPGVDLYHAVPYAVHLYRAKRKKAGYTDEIKRYLMQG